MESHPESSGFSSLQKLLEELATLITDVSHCQNNAWVKNTELDALFRAKHGVSIATALQAQVSGSDLRNVLGGLPRFRIYPTSNPQEFYIRLVDEFRSSGVANPKVRQSTKRLEYQPIRVPEMRSIEDLEFALIEIVMSLTSFGEFTSIEQLSEKFRAYYEQPIEPVMRCVCPGWQLIELLQTIPTLHVQQIDDHWQIRLMTNPTR